MATTAKKTTAKKSTATKTTAKKSTATKTTEPKSATKSATKTASSRSAAAQPKGGTLSAEERAAMKEYIAEKKAVAGRRGSASDKAKAALQDVLDAIAKLPDDERELATRVHELVMIAAPELAPRTWYGMPAYAKDDAVLCFFQPAGKFKARYATLGFNDAAQLDDGPVWPTAYAVDRLTKDAERTITQLVRRAVG